mgnify:CR=1 FL=1
MSKPLHMNSARIRNIAFVVLILVIFTVYSLHHSSVPVSYTFEEEYMSLHGPTDADFLVQIPYTDIRSVSLVESPDFGRDLSGTSTKSCLNGTWENETYGVYALYAWAKVTDCIVLETSDGFILCNFESNDATSHLCTAIQELLAKKNVGE